MTHANDTNPGARETLAASLDRHLVVRTDPDFRGERHVKDAAYSRREGYTLLSADGRVALIDLLPDGCRLTSADGAVTVRYDERRIPEVVGADGSRIMRCGDASTVDELLTLAASMTVEV